MATTVLQLKKQVAFYLRKARTDFVVDSEDHMLHALNNVRRDLEKSHDFLHLESTATASITNANGVALSSATVANSLTINTIRRYFLNQTDPVGQVPLFHYTKEHISVKQLERDQKEVWDYADRFRPDEGERTATSARPKVYRQGGTIFLDPAPTSAQTVGMDVITWAADYTADGDNDFFTNFCTSYLMWGAVVFLNAYSGTFVERTEGVVPFNAIKRRVEEAKAEAIMHDIFLRETGRIPFV
jgi:hypothetical protein